MKNKGGRPKKINALVIKKLEEAFALGCADSEACFYAGISKQCLYDYEKKNPEFSDRKEALKESPVLKARKVVIEAFKKNPELAFKFLERKCRKEFGPKNEVSGKFEVESNNKESAKESILKMLSEHFHPDGTPRETYFEGEDARKMGDDNARKNRIQN